MNRYPPDQPRDRRRDRLGAAVEKSGFGATARRLTNLRDRLRREGKDDEAKTVSSDLWWVQGSYAGEESPKLVEAAGNIAALAK